MTEEPRTEAQMRASAELVVDTCFEVTEGDVVTIITDDRRKPEAEIVATVVSERGGLPIVANNETQIRRALADTHFPMVPPRNLHQAMVTSDQIIIMTNLEWANRFAHVPAVKESVANMARIGSIEEGFGRWPISVADIEATIGNAKKAIARLEGKKRVRVTSPAGTDVTVSIERRPALEVVPVKQPGAMMGPAPLWGEVAYAAVEDQTNGTIVIDGNMLGIGIPRHVENPITWHVEDGKYQAIEGGAEARRHHRCPRDRDRCRVRVRHERLRAGGRSVGEGPEGHRALRSRRQPELLPRRPEPERPAPGWRVPQRVAADP